MVSIEQLLEGLKNSIENLGTFTLIAILVIVVVLIILIVVEKKLRKKVTKKEDRNNYYFEKINKINKSDTEGSLKQINKIAKGFFKERFKVNRSLTYSELKDFFIKEKNKRASEFCVNINEALYSNNKSDEIVLKLLNDLVNLIRAYPIPINKEKSKDKSKNIKVSRVNKKKL